MLSSLLVAGAAQAATIPVPSGGFGWVGLSGFVLNGNGDPYFDHTSSDGSPPGSIWQVLNDQGIPDSRLEFWGATGGDADPNILFDLAPGAESLSLTIRFEFAASAGVNEFGWFAGDLGGNGYQASDLNPVFGGPATPGASTVVALPDGAYGFYLKNTATGNVFLSSAGLSPTDSGNQHFAVFRDTAAPDTLWIAVEALNLDSGDQDYNDFVVTAIAEIPEPGTLALLGSGLAMTGLGLRRWRGRGIS